jgi:hypothetical protein
VVALHYVRRRSGQSGFAWVTALHFSSPLEIARLTQSVQARLVLLRTPRGVYDRTVIWALAAEREPAARACSRQAPLRGDRVGRLPPALRILSGRSRREQCLHTFVHALCARLLCACAPPTEEPRTPGSRRAIPITSVSPAAARRPRTSTRSCIQSSISPAGALPLDLGAFTGSRHLAHFLVFRAAVFLAENERGERRRLRRDYEVPLAVPVHQAGCDV